MRGCGGSVDAISCAAALYMPVSRYLGRRTWIWLVGGVGSRRLLPMLDDRGTGKKQGSGNTLAFCTTPLQAAKKSRTANSVAPDRNYPPHSVIASGESAQNIGLTFPRPPSSCPAYRVSLGNGELLLDRGGRGNGRSRRGSSDIILLHGRGGETRAKFSPHRTAEPAGRESNAYWVVRYCSDAELGFWGRWHDLRT